MKRKIAASDAVKNIIIVLLMLSAMVLAYMVFTSDSPWTAVSQLFTGRRTEVASAAGEGTETFEVPHPVYIMVTSQSGEHFAAKYDNQVKTYLFSRYSALLGEALGSASKPEKISEEQWQATLMYSNVFFDYVYPVNLSYLADRLGTTVSKGLEDTEAARLCIACDGESLIFAFINVKSGSIYSYSTALSSDILYGSLSQQDTNNSHYSFEMGDDYSYLDRYFIFSDEALSLNSVSVRSPWISEMNIPDLLASFGMSLSAAQEYSESDGSAVYVDGSKRLGIDVRGSILFNAAGSEGALGEKIDADAPKHVYFEQAEALANDVLSRYIGEGKLVCTGGEFSTNPATAVIYLGYNVGGVPVSFTGERYAAKVKFSGGDVVRVELTVREYSLTGTTEAPLPETQAVALASGSGGFPVLFFEDAEGSSGYKWLLLR